MTPLHRAWTDGVIQGLREFAWWQEGIQWVGQKGTGNCQSLKSAILMAENVWADEYHPSPPPQPCTLCKEDDA